VTPLQEAGITAISGRIVVDDDRFDSERYVRDWPRSFRYEESGALGALTVNESQLGRWIGGTSTRTPDLRVGATFRTLLARAGIEVTGGVASGSVPADATQAGLVTSAPLAKLLAHMLQTSDNFYAETLLKDIAVDRYGPGQGTTANGRRAARLELQRAGVDLADERWADGSGLAYTNALTARVLGQVLGIGAQEPWADAWIGAFAVAGRSPGTLERRLDTWPYRDRVHAKTGTLRHVSALAGFADRLGSDHRYGFAVVTYDASGRPVSYTAAKRLQDRIAKILVR
jgi:D-alanyl-D-alanine carboxypeptidase/D-alanyl-D-alanine-endopeptidase (penicillin-binding protein 4)